jgi:hypothetical protein
MKKAGQPHADTALAKFIEKKVLELRPKKTQAEISIEAGFAQPNMVAMLKRGAMKLPIDRVPGLAKALETDAAHLMLLALEQAHGDTTARALLEIFGTAVTRNERAWLNEIRQASGNVDPSLTARARSAIRGIFGK